MEISFTPEEQKTIEGLALRNGTSPAEQVRRIIVDALQRQEDYDRWFRQKVREAREAMPHGDFLDHAAVGRILDERYLG